MFWSLLVPFFGVVLIPDGDDDDDDDDLEGTSTSVQEVVCFTTRGGQGIS